MSRKVHSEHILATKSAHAHGGGVSGKVHSEHILATKVLMPMGGWGGLGKCSSEHILATKVLMPIWRGGVGCPGKCTLSTLLATKVLMPVGVVECPGKCTIQVMSQGMSTFLVYQREVCNRYPNCLLIAGIFSCEQSYCCVVSVTFCDQIYLLQYHIYTARYYLCNAENNTSQEK